LEKGVDDGGNNQELFHQKQWVAAVGSSHGLQPGFYLNFKKGKFEFSESKREREREQERERESESTVTQNVSKMVSILDSVSFAPPNPNYSTSCWHKSLDRTNGRSRDGCLQGVITTC
jgi:hypothetical protein